MVWSCPVKVCWLECYSNESSIQRWFLRSLALFSCADWLIQGGQNLFLVLDQYCHEHANTCVCYYSSHRSTIQMLGFFSRFDYLFWPTNAVYVGTEPWKIKADRNCPVMSLCAFIFQLFKLSFCWNSPLHLCGYFKYFILLNLLSEYRLLSSKYRFHINFFFSLFVGILTLLCRMKYSPFLCSCNILHQFPKDNNLLYSHFIRINYTQK